MVSFPHKIRILTKKKEAKKKYQQQSQYFYKIALHKSKGQREIPIFAHYDYFYKVSA
jgi:hypothetical protein